MKKAAMAAMLLALTVPAISGTNASVSLTWTMPTRNIDGTPLTDLAGAKVYYGTASSNYMHVVDVGLCEAATITGLTAGATYYLNGTAYNAAGLESDFCAEVAKQARLAIVAPTLFIFTGDGGQQEAAE